MGGTGSCDGVWPGGRARRRHGAICSRNREPSATPAHADAVLQLREGDPSIEPVPGSYVKDTLEFATWTFQPGEAEVITRRLKEILKA